MSDDPPIGQHPYTDPPPPERRRFYEDPKPPEEASNAQVMQGRGAPPPYPGAEHQQQAVERPPEPAAGEVHSTSMTVGQLLALPVEQQNAILEAMRLQAGPIPPPPLAPNSQQGTAGMVGTPPVPC